MATGASGLPTGGDGPSGQGSPSRRKLGSQFSWSSSAPSPAEISGLERHFPEVIQLPTAAVDREVEVWTTSGLILRTLTRWVPPEAVIRELRRAGLSGKIELISLAHRTYLAKFELVEARQAVLKQPWVINGQPLAVEAWHPDFIPADDALRHALLWVRLPNLPLEYWSEETLQSILSVAGQYVDADGSTKERRRGSFARACVRVDLGRPLRPGARIRANGPPFWQQFTYEHVDCICSSCGTVHLSGNCLASSEQGAAAMAPLYGPWMAALRLRKPSAGLQSEGETLGKARSGASKGKASVDSAGELEGWMKPGKVARRRPVQSSSLPKASAIIPGNVKEKEPCREDETVPVTVQPVIHEAVAKSWESPYSGSPSIPISNPKGKSKGNCNAGVKKKISVTPFKFQAESSVAEENAHSVLQGKSSEIKSGVQMKGIGNGEANPFTTLGSDRWAGRPKSRGDANPASPKRARDAEGSGFRLVSKASKGKSRASSLSKGPLRVDEVVKTTGPLLGLDGHEAALLALSEALADSPLGSPGAEPNSTDQINDDPMEPDQEPVPVMYEQIEMGIQMESPESGDSPERGMDEDPDGEKGSSVSL